MSKTGEGLAEFGRCKEGTPYVYGTKGADGALTQTRVNALAAAYPIIFTADYLKKIAEKELVGKVCCDCSGLISWYTNYVLGSAQLYAQAYTRLPIAAIRNFAVGTILWKKGHVGVYLGIVDGVPCDVQSKGIDYGCLMLPCTETEWKYGLTFPWLTYHYTVNLAAQATWKGTNPYSEPTVVVTTSARAKEKGITQYSSNGEGVKWLQWELNESGSTLKIDGVMGSKALEALEAYQMACDLTSDGLAGSITRRYLKGEETGQ